MKQLKLTNIANNEALTSDVLSILLWNDERLLHTYDAGTEYAMLQEEYNELQQAIKDNNIHEILDAYCDIYVVFYGSVYKAKLNNVDVKTTLKEYDKWYNIVSNIESTFYGYGYRFKCCIQETLDEIFSRTGSVNLDTGKWEKDKSEEAKSKWVTANYEKCKLKKETETEQ